MLAVGAYLRALLFFVTFFVTGDSDNGSDDEESRSGRSLKLSYRV